jgi:hypothetical protein
MCLLLQQTSGRADPQCNAMSCERVALSSEGSLFSVQVLQLHHSLQESPPAECFAKLLTFFLDYSSALAAGGTLFVEGIVRRAKAFTTLLELGTGVENRPACQAPGHLLFDSASTTM